MNTNMLAFVMTDKATETYPETGPPDARWHLILAHGAGAPMDSSFMRDMSELLGKQEIAVTRFEFPYMAMRRETGRKRPPDRVPILLNAWRRAIDHVVSHHPDRRLAIGGKSMGGRMATLLAAQSDRPEQIEALVTLGYPFHPAGKPERLRIDHFPQLGDMPVLMVQGTRDALGGHVAVATYPLPAGADLFWIETGNHDLKPLKSSGLTQDEALARASERISVFLNPR